MKKFFLSIVLILFIITTAAIVSVSAADTQLATPEITSMSNVSEGVRINWAPIEGVYKYRLYYKNSKGGWTRITETADTFGYDTVVSNKATYTYTVRGVDLNGSFVTDFNRTGWRHTYQYPFSKPEITGMTNVSEGVRIEWTPIEGVYKYRLYYKNNKGGWTRITETADTYGYDTVVSNNSTYTYTVQGVNEYGRFVTDWNSQGWKHTYKYPFSKPEITTFTDDYEGIHIYWTPIEGVYKYRVYYKNSKGGWTRITETADTSALDADVKYNGAYTYTVQGVNQKGRFITDWNSKGWKHTYGVATPQISALVSTEDGVKISWDSVVGASEYRVYYKNRSNKWVKMDTVQGTSYTDTEVAYNTTYTYTVRCYDSTHDRFISGFNSAGWKHTYTYPYDRPSVTGFSDDDNGVHINWNPVEGVYKYRVYYKGSSGWARIAETTDSTALYTDIKDNETKLFTVRGMNRSGQFVTDFHSAGWSHTYHRPVPTEAPTEAPTAAPTEAPLSAPANVQVQTVTKGSRTYDTVGKWSIWKSYKNDSTGAQGDSDRFTYIANETNVTIHPGEKPLEKERYIESYLEYSENGSQVTVHWEKTPDKEGCSFLSYDVDIFHKTENEDEYIGEKNYWQRFGKSKGFVWNTWDDAKQEWVVDDISKDDTSCTFDLPILSETPAKAKLNWAPVERADKYVIEIFQDGKWSVAATVKTNTYSFSPEYDSSVHYRVKAVSQSGTTSPYTYKTVSTKSMYVKDKDGYTYEEPVIESQMRDICNQCKSDVTGDNNIRRVFHKVDGTTELRGGFIGDRYPEAYEKYCEWYDKTLPRTQDGPIEKLTEEQFRYGHPNTYQHIDDEGQFYVTWDDGEYGEWDIIDYHWLTGCGNTGRWHTERLNVEIGTRTIEVPESGHYELIIK